MAEAAKLAGAVGDAEQSVSYADRSGDAFWKMGTRTTHADALHQAGRRAEAETRFREAEQMQQERQPDYPLLYSQGGFRYCDLLLAAPERDAWREMQNEKCRMKKEELVATCRAVSQRAAQTLKWLEAARVDLLSIALDHLTLGRAALYAAILESRSRRESAQTSSASELDQRGLTSAATELDAAVAGLRRSGDQDVVPHALLTRAWLWFLTGARTGPESAQADLDEAWEIAERGPMRLFLADVLLSRARLFGMKKEECRMQNEKTPYPWKLPQDDLAAAEKLIEACGYHRRDDELADAKQAILGS